MAAAKRNLGRELLTGLRHLKRGEYSRVTWVPSIATIREGTGLPRPTFAKNARYSAKNAHQGTCTGAAQARRDRARVNAVQTVELIENEAAEAVADRHWPFLVRSVAQAVLFATTHFCRHARRPVPPS